MQHFVWATDPTLVSLGPLHIRWYGLLFATAFWFGYGIMRRIFRREGKPESDLEPLFMYMMVGTLVGARLGHILFYDPVYYAQHPLEILAVWHGGLASHGGAIGIFIALFLYSRRRQTQSYLWVLDRMAIPAMLGGVFIRLGNFFNSEIVGTPSDLPWAVVFARIDVIPRHPTQLYEAACYLAIFLVLSAVYWRRGPEVRGGVLSGLFLLLVFSARFFLEYVKTHQAAYGQDYSLSVGQMLSIPMVMLGAFLLGRTWASRGSSRTLRQPAQ